MFHDKAKRTQQGNLLDMRTIFKRTFRRKERKWPAKREWEGQEKTRWGNLILWVGLYL